MSVTDVARHSASDRTSSELSGTRIRRLAVEAGKYLGRNAGQPVPLHELEAQAEANGYTGDELKQMLADSGVEEADSVTVPRQGDLFGSLWAPDAGVPSPSPQTETSGALERFREWLQEKADNDSTGHSYSRRAATRRYARAKDVGRWFVNQYDQFSTVFITYCRPRSEDESIPEHASQFYPRSVVGKRRRLLKDLGVHGEHAGVSVLAPKHGPDGGEEHRNHGVPHPSAQTHAHDFLWIPGTVSETDLEGLASITDADVDISVEAHGSSDVTTPDSVANRGNGMDAERGATTALPHELGANLPLLQTRLDARGLPKYAEHWCAKMRFGTDGSLDTKGADRFRKHGRFAELADAQKWERRIREGARVGAELARRF